MRQMTDHMRKSVAADLRGNLTYRAIADRYTISLSSVARVARLEGLTATRKTPAELIRSGSFPGLSDPKSFAGWLLSMPDDVVNWLCAETPHGARASDVVRAIVVDAYHAESDRRTATTQNANPPATGQKTGVCE